MSRYCGERDPSAILKSAEYWRTAALFGQGSVLSDKRLWTDDGIVAVDRYYIQQPDEGEGGFHQKLETQLAPAGPEVKQLVAEMFWLLYLCPSSLNPSHKRRVISQVWSWSGEAFPSASPLLADEVLTGIGSAGPGFNQNQWRELTFLTRIVQAFRSAPSARQQKLVADPWEFAEWLGQVQDARSRQFRHMLLFMMFPDDFERIFGQRDRKSVAIAFSGRNAQHVNGLEPVQLDRLLRETRASLEERYGTKELDYYVSPLAEQWNRSDLSAVAGDIRADHVTKALADIDRDGIPPDAQSTGYDLIYGVNRYPPKLVLSLATRHATGEPLDRSAFSGGESSSAFQLLRSLGFQIETKDAIASLVAKFLEQSSRGDLSVRDYPQQYRGLEVKVSFGKGNIARIPWIAFLAEDQAVSEGIYPVFLFFRDQRALALCYGVSETNRSRHAWTGVDARETVEEWFKREFNRTPDRYDESLVRATYRTDQQIPFHELTRELDAMISEYRELMGVEGLQKVASSDDVAIPDAVPLEVRPDLIAAAESFAAALKQANVSFGSRHDELIRVLLASLATKPFLILTGMSGSGKSQVAIRLGEWLGSRLYVAAVRPDWTGSEALFGYEDALKRAEGGRAAWAVPPPLEFMLKALHDPDHPYLLLLDEMNLAHVERYFADVLSGMESRQRCLPNLAKDSDGCWRVAPAADSRVPFPRNLWIVGTVNIDETTYMFSPKVLDRANTFEFRVDTADLSADIRKPSPCAAGEAPLVRGLLAIANDDRWHERTSTEFREEIANRIRTLHSLLSRNGLEFGHRAFYEALRFAALMQAAGIEERERILDCIIMQRVLPRLHGSRRKLELPLLGLAHFTRDLPDEVLADDLLASSDLERGTNGRSPKLPLSHNKITRMLRALRLNQFASFTE